MSSSRVRPCDSCRQRKTRCVKPINKRECILCAFHGKQCTYLRAPPPRAARRPGSMTGAGGAGPGGPGGGVLGGAGVAKRPSAASPTVGASVPPVASSASWTAASASPESGYSGVGGLGSGIGSGSGFLDFMTLSPDAFLSSSSFMDGLGASLTPQPAMSVTSANAAISAPGMSTTATTAAATAVSADTVASSASDDDASAVDPMDTPLSLLHGTLGLDLNTHPEYIGPGNYQEPALLDLCRTDSTGNIDPMRGVYVDGFGSGGDRSSGSYINSNSNNNSNSNSNNSNSNNNNSNNSGSGGGGGGSSSSQAQKPPVRLARRLDSRTMFLIYPDEATASEEQRIADCDAIEECVQPLGKALVDLYFRIVHPSFPVLHKGVYLTKHAVSHRLFSPPLLAAVYLVALDYQLYDPAIVARGARPVSAHGQTTLELLAERTMTEDLQRPKLSTLEAGLLLLQRSRFGARPSSRLFTAQLVVVAQGLGLHVDCRDWAIPEWEKGLRRRLAWALYTQDRWGALVQGRPPLLSDDGWDLQPCSEADFPETSADEDADADGGGGGGGDTDLGLGLGGGDADSGPAHQGSVHTDTGREIFMRHAQLAQLLSDVLACFYTSVATKPGGTLDRMGPAAAVAMAQPLLARLREWHAALPAALALDRVHFSRLSANASLYVAHAAVEVAVHRALLRALTADVASAELVRDVRAAARQRVVATIRLLSSLRAEHTGAFWSGVAAHQLVSFGSLVGLLWATTDDAAEVAWCNARMDELRWALRVRGREALFMQEALRLLDGAGGPLGMITRRSTMAED